MSEWAGKQAAFEHLQARVAELEAEVERSTARAEHLRDELESWRQRGIRAEAEVEKLLRDYENLRVKWKQAEVEIEKLREQLSHETDAGLNFYRAMKQAEAKLAEVKEMWEIAAEAQVERSEKAEAKVEKLREEKKEMQLQVWSIEDAVIRPYQADLEVRAERAEAKLAEVEKERNAISVQCGEERKARHAAEKVNADEVLAKRTNLNAQIESLTDERDELQVLRRREQKRYQDYAASIERARELAEGGKFADNPGDTWRFREIARLLSGKAE